MNTTKNFSKSELFTVMNSIRSEKHVSQKEAYKLAVEKLSMPSFDANDFRKNSSLYRTTSGHKVKYICDTRGKMFVQIKSNVSAMFDMTRKYDTNGSCKVPMYDLKKI